MTLYKLILKNRNETTFTVVKELTNEPIEINNFNPFEYKLFNEDVFTFNRGIVDIVSSKIRNVNDTDPNGELYIQLPLHATIKLFNEDKSGKYFSENNGDFLKETGLLKLIKSNDELLRPYMVSQCKYDFLFGAENTFTPFRYELNYRNYFLLTSGQAIIKLSPPKYTQYLSLNKDYENFEFKSPINPWNVQSEFKDQFSKVKCLEFHLNIGQVVYIPAFWWYSIQFHKDTTIASLKYKTYMNTIAIIPNLALNILQLQNIKRNSAKKIDIKELNNEKQLEDKAETIIQI